MVARIVRLRVPLYFLVFFLLCGFAQITDGLLFGPEFTFKPEGKADETYPSAQQELDRKKIADYLQNVCGDRAVNKCAVSLSGTDPDHYGTMYDVKYENGMWFRLTNDADVIEVKMKASTVSEFEAVKKLIQEDLFDTMTKFNLKPHSYEGAGHIHLDFDSVFKNDRLLFRNFVVDVVNEFELPLSRQASRDSNALSKTLACRGKTTAVCSVADSGIMR